MEKSEKVKNLAEKKWLITIKGKMTKPAGRGFDYAKMGEKMEDALLDIRLRSKDEIDKERKGREQCETEGKHQPDKNEYKCSRCMAVLNEENKPAEDKHGITYDMKPSDKRDFLFESIKNIEPKEDELTIIGVLNRLAVSKEQRKAKWEAMRALQANFGVTDDVIERVERESMLAISYLYSGEIEEK